MLRSCAGQRRALRASLALAAGSALLSGIVMPASADPVYPSAKQVAAAKAAARAKAGQVGAVEAQLAASNARLAAVQAAAEKASEQYNGARVLLDQRTAAAGAAQQRAASAAELAATASDKVGQLAAAAYMQGGSLGGLETFLSSNGPQDILDRAAGLAVVSGIRQQTLEQASASSVVAGVLQRQAAQALAQQEAAAQAAEQARAAAQAQADAAAAQTAQIKHQQDAMIAQLATLRHTSVVLEHQRQAGLQAEAEARAEAAARAAAEARARAAREAAAREAARRAAEAAAGGGSSAPAPAGDPTPPPVSSGSVSAVLAFARAQLGEPYLWGAAGPSSWDCSGLTMMAWARAGVSLSHYTGSQWAETARVSIDDLRPGDLVFYGDSGPTSHHVGLYIGGGQMIEAPHTGASVRVASIWRSDLLPYGGRPSW